MAQEPTADDWLAWSEFLDENDVFSTSTRRLHRSSKQSHSAQVRDRSSDKNLTIVVHGRRIVPERIVCY